MIIYRKILVLFVLLLPLGYAMPQSVEALESRFNALQNRLSYETRMHDSLNTLWNNRVKMIERVKSDSPENKTLVSSLMSGSVNLSKSVTAWGNKIEITNRECDKLKNQLYEKYTQMIESLNNVKNDPAVKKQIVLYTEKRLSVSPSVSQLSVNPEKLISLDINRIKNSEEKQIYTEYLLVARQEVSRELDRVSASYREADNIIRLEKKSRRFIEETEFENKALYSQTRNSKSKAAYQSGQNPADGAPHYNVGNAASNTLNAQYIAHSMVLMQLNNQQKPSDSGKFESISKNNRNVSLIEYRDLLAKLRTRLQDYKTILTHKYEQIIGK